MASKYPTKTNKETTKDVAQPEMVFSMPVFNVLNCDRNLLEQGWTTELYNECDWSQRTSDALAKVPEKSPSDFGICSQRRTLQEAAKV
ncbi:hypothetical protein R6Q59_036135 [Mikania micrantha]